MSAALAIAGVTFRQALRDRVLHVLVGGALVAIFFSKAVGWVSPADDRRVVVDLTLATLSVFSVLVAVILGGRLIVEDVQRRTLHTICAKDVSRGAVILGKYIGLLSAFAAGLCAVAPIAAIYTLLVGGDIGVGYFAALGGLLGELAILVAASVFFSTVSSPMIAAIGTLAVWGVGHNSEILRWFVEGWQAGYARTMAQWLYYVLPNLETLNFRPHAAYQESVEAAHVALAALVAAGWSTLFLSGAWAVFREKDL